MQSNKVAIIKQNARLTDEVALKWVSKETAKKLIDPETTGQRNYKFRLATEAEIAKAKGQAQHDENETVSEMETVKRGPYRPREKGGAQ